jgi:DnaJ-domain-containing protein 1
MTRKFVEGAKSSLNSLLDKVLADETPLSGVERDELDAELERRNKARQGTTAKPEDNPRARWAGAGEEAARHRKQAADAREKRIRGERAEKKKVEDAARERAWEKFQDDARRQGASSSARPPSGAGASGARPGGARPSGGSASSGSSGSSGRRPGAGFGPRSDKIAKFYKVLDLPYGADFDQVKASYRKLMRRYHPDLHTQSPQKAKAATELSMQVTQAYNELERHLLGDPSKKA